MLRTRQQFRKCILVLQLARYFLFDNFFNHLRIYNLKIDCSENKTLNIHNLAPSNYNQIVCNVMIFNKFIILNNDISV